MLMHLPGRIATARSVKSKIPADGRSPPNDGEPTESPSALVGGQRHAVGEAPAPRHAAGLVGHHRMAGLLEVAQNRRRDDPPQAQRAMSQRRFRARSGACRDQPADGQD